jgi:hypothetical protein
VAGLFLIALSCACAYAPTTSLAYRPLPIDAKPGARPALAVEPFSEARPPRSYPSGLGSMFKTYIPLLPYVRIPYGRLDETSVVHEEAKKERGHPLDRETQHFTQSMPRAIADDLRASGLFSEVRVLSAGEAPAAGAYVLGGSLKSTEYDVNATSYMLGIAGVLLWLLPIPCSWQTGHVEAELRLVDPAGQVVWQHALSGEGQRIFTLYNSGGAPVSSRYRLEIKRYGSNDEGIDGDSLWAYHASAIRSGMGPVKESLAAYLGTAR